MFKDRRDAGAQLVQRLMPYQDNPEVIVLGLPRGGVVTAAEVARRLKAPLDIVVPRKIGAPGNPEFAIGAVAEDGSCIIDQRIVSLLSIPPAYIEKAAAEERREAERRLKIYRAGLPARDLSGKIVILVDDGVATGMTMRAAIKTVRQFRAKRVVVAVPVVAADTVEVLKREADEIIYVEAPFDFGAVGRFYEAFEQVSDEGVISLLRKKVM